MCIDGGCGGKEAGGGEAVLYITYTKGFFRGKLLSWFVGVIIPMGSRHRFQHAQSVNKLVLGPTMLYFAVFKDVCTILVFILKLFLGETSTHLVKYAIFPSYPFTRSSTLTSESTQGKDNFRGLDGLC